VAHNGFPAFTGPSSLMDEYLVLVTPLQFTRTANYKEGMKEMLKH